MGPGGQLLWSYGPIVIAFTRFLKYKPVKVTPLYLYVTHKPGPRATIPLGWAQAGWRTPSSTEAEERSMSANRLPFEGPGMEGEFRRVEVRRSGRRRKTISAEIVGDALVVSVPDRMSRADEDRWVATMAQRMSERRRRDRMNSDGDLGRRAAQLGDRYLGGLRARDVAWTGEQRSRWGWCSPQDGRIRLSLALSEYPAWVRDYVLVHELAHLVVADHSARFWDLVNRYPLTERARGFLIAKGMEEG
jgi:predicted metal-dependent hydrolase